MDLKEILKDRPYNYQALLDEAKWQVEFYRKQVEEAEKQLKLRELALLHLEENKLNNNKVDSYFSK
tara:strand:- start:329 stop:526 length:198 start_codon:yes stop_codon:yes gene_type:complete